MKRKITMKNVICDDSEINYDALDAEMDALVEALAKEEAELPEEVKQEIRENKLRERLHQEYMNLHKSDTTGGYRIKYKHERGGDLVAGENYDLTLDDVEEYIASLDQ